MCKVSKSHLINSCTATLGWKREGTSGMTGLAKPTESMRAWGWALSWNGREYLALTSSGCLTWRRSHAEISRNRKQTDGRDKGCRSPLGWRRENSNRGFMFFFVCITTLCTDAWKYRQVRRAMVSPRSTTALSGDRAVLCSSTFCHCKFLQS